MMPNDSPQPPHTFSDLMKNPDRDYIEGTIATMLHHLERDQGLAHAQIAEVMFEWLMIEMEPQDPVTAEQTMKWMGQMHRFRDAINARLDAVDKHYQTIRHDDPS